MKVRNKHYKVCNNCLYQKHSTNGSRWCGNGDDPCSSDKTSGFCLKDELRTDYEI